MKKSLLAAATLVAAPAFAEGELKVYHWFEYIPQELVDKFTAETGIAVTIDTYDSNESMLAALKAGKLGEYDVAVPADFMVGIMKADGMLDTFTPEEMPNFANIAPQWLDVPFDQGRTSSIPYQWGTTSFSVNRDVYPGDISSLAVIFNPAAGTAGQDQRPRQPERSADPRLALPWHPAMHDRPRAAEGTERHAAQCQAVLGQLRV